MIGLRNSLLEVDGKHQYLSTKYGGVEGFPRTSPAHFCDERQMTVGKTAKAVA